MRGIIANILKYDTCDKSRDELVRLFNSLKTSSQSDRFDYIRVWNGTQEVEPVVLSAGLAQKADTTSDTKVLLATGSELKEAVQDGTNVRNGL